MIHERIKLEMPGSEIYANVVTYVISHSEEIGIDKRPLVIVCPGGGYCFTSEREAEMFALKWNAYGYHAMVLWYSVRPAVYPAALLELAKAVTIAREHAELWHIDVDKIFIQGSSAGGHLAASYGMFWNRSFLADELHTESAMLKPAGMILSYPVITSGEYAHRESFENLLGDAYEDQKEELSLEKQVSDDTPPAFVWTTNEDDLVPAENSILLALAMRKKKIPVELHMYMKGGHGLALASELTMGNAGENIEPSCQGWFELAYRWTQEMIKADK
jgi:acetyl esterase/lipase